MKKISLLLLLVALIKISNAQNEKIITDSIKLYNQQLVNLSDGFYKSPAYVSLRKHIDSLRILTDNYTGAFFYCSISSADFNILNGDNKNSGFDNFSGSMFGIGAGLSYKKNRRIFDFNLVAIGLNKKATYKDEDIKISFTTGFQFEWGYDFIKSKKINLYPYGGFGIRGSYFEYVGSKQINSSPSNITNIVKNDNSTVANIVEVSYQGGLGFEIVLTEAEDGGGTIFCVKAGTNNAFNNKSYDFSGYKYNPKFDFGRLNVMVGFKFFAR